MSRENMTARVERAYEQLNETGELPDDVLDAEVIWHTPADIPESGTLHGEDAVKRHIAGYVAAFDVFRVESREFIDLGDRIVASIVLHGRVRGTQDEVELAGAQVMRENAEG